MKPVNINFLKFTPLYFALSALVIIPGLISLVLFGLKPAVDFTGGTLIELSAVNKDKTPVSESVIREVLANQHIDVSSIQTTNNSFLVRTKPISQDQNQQFQDSLQKKVEGVVTEQSFETVGPTLGAELLKKTIYAISLASLIILGYIAYRFREIKFGLAAVLAMFHDTIVVLGVFSLLGHFYNVEVDTLFVTALLTVISFSVHDTIVVYDRIRETLKRHSKANFYAIVNESITETLSRSINNSMTIIFMLLALFLLGGSTTKWFIFALLIGTITGTYSSTFTACPLLSLGHSLETKFRQRKRK
jgi:preprotein translocase subunit SecF